MHFYLFLFEDVARRELSCEVSLYRESLSEGDTGKIAFYSSAGEPKHSVTRWDACVLLRVKSRCERGAALAGAGMCGPWQLCGVLALARQC